MSVSDCLNRSLSAAIDTITALHKQTKQQCWQIYIERCPVGTSLGRTISAANMIGDNDKRQSESSINPAGHFLEPPVFTGIAVNEAFRLHIWSD
jgi:hypothetical protein